MSKTKLPPASKLTPEEYQRIYPMAYALREAGFVPIPRFWIKGDDMPKLRDFTDQYRDEIVAIRRAVDAKLGITAESHEDIGPLPIGIASDATDDPRFDRDAAWKAWESANGKK